MGRALEKAIPEFQDVPLQHLRRFARTEDLPLYLLPKGLHVIRKHICPSGLDAEKSVERSRSNGNTEAIEASPLESESSAKNSLHLMICDSNIIALDNLVSHFSAIVENTPSVLPAIPAIQKVLVPLYPPTSVEEAQQWSRSYWPTVYKKHNPNGPHPSIVSRATQLITERVGVYMALAQRAAREASEAGAGEPIGAVVANPFPPLQNGDETPLPAVVVAAGDGRRAGPLFACREEPGNPTAHAVMRAIALVARKRRELMSQEQAASAEPQISDDAFGKIFQDSPVFPIERSTLSQNSLAPNGYLCTSLELYVTHEPCVMCSMAILHSRFDKIVFAKRMPQTGALTVEQVPADCLPQSTEDFGQPGLDKSTLCGLDLTGEPCDIGKKPQGLGYGLYWRNELNWKLLGWQYAQADEEGNEEDCMTVQPGVHV